MQNSKTPTQKSLSIKVSAISEEIAKQRSSLRLMQEKYQKVLAKKKADALRELDDRAYKFIEDLDQSDDIVQDEYLLVSPRNNGKKSVGYVCLLSFSSKHEIGMVKNLGIYNIIGGVKPKGMTWDNAMKMYVKQYLSSDSLNSVGVNEVQKQTFICEKDGVNVIYKVYKTLDTLTVDKGFDIGLNYVNPGILRLSKLSQFAMSISVDLFVDGKLDKFTGLRGMVDAMLPKGQGMSDSIQINTAELYDKGKEEVKKHVLNLAGMKECKKAMDALQANISYLRKMEGDNCILGNKFVDCWYRNQSLMITLANLIYVEVDSMDEYMTQYINDEFKTLGHLRDRMVPDIHLRE